MSAFANEDRLPLPQIKTEPTFAGERSESPPSNPSLTERPFSLNVDSIARPSSSKAMMVAIPKTISELCFSRAYHRIPFPDGIKEDLDFSAGAESDIKVKEEGKHTPPLARDSESIFCKGEFGINQIFIKEEHPDYDQGDSSAHFLPKPPNQDEFDLSHHTKLDVLQVPCAVPKDSGELRLGESYKCTTCGAHFDAMDALGAHVSAHHPSSEIFWCSKCEVKFAFKEHLRSHYATHTREKKFGCPCCPKMFTQKKGLQNHMLIHAGVRAFACPHCARAFTHKRTLRQHLVVHTGEKRFECSLCSRKFAHKLTLSRHLRVHAGARPHVCQDCKKAFTHKSGLIEHARVHAGNTRVRYECDACSKTFVRKAYLRQHVLTHTGRKPFACPQCQRGFTQKVSLQRHHLTHTGEKPFECHLCEMRFTYKVSLGHHLKRYHGGAAPAGGASAPVTPSCEVGVTTHVTPTPECKERATHSLSTRPSYEMSLTHDTTPRPVVKRV